MAEVITKEEAQELRASLHALKAEVGKVACAAKDRVVTGTTEWAKEHPGASVGIVAGVAAAIGFVLGIMVARGRD